MKKAVAIASLAVMCTAGSVIAQNPNFSYNFDRGPIKRVLLISIDGMHAIDYQNCAKGLTAIDSGVPYCPTLAALAQTGINYVQASTSKPSDSFPGLTAIVTGGSPALTGVYYDVAYDRSLNAPITTTGNGNAGHPCTPGVAPTGYTTEYEEGIDIDQTKLNGGAPGAALTDGGLASIDPDKLPHDKNCAPVYPWEFVRANSIFQAIHAVGGYTAWADKHPAYASVASGPGGFANLDDFYSPEVNSTVIGLPGVTTPTGVSCASVLDPGSDTTSWTNSFQNIQCYDTLKVNAIVNQIDAKNHLGTAATQLPIIFGMNFQAVSVGEKLIEKSNGKTGGYLDAMGTPSAPLLGQIKFVDASIGAFVAELKKRGIYGSTMIVITAKHGQNPIDPTRYNPILNQTFPVAGSSPATLLDNAGYVPYSEAPSNPTGIGPTEDDISMVWLKNSSETEAAVKILEDNPEAIGMGEIYYGASLALNFNDPAVDPRTPDIITVPNVGVVYTGSTKKQEEHGGFNHDDTNVMLLLSYPSFNPRTVQAAVSTAQVAPTILQALYINPATLDAVREEGVSILPAVPLQ